MKTKAVRLYGADDIRLEEFELPAITGDELLVKIVSDSACMSSYKITSQGAAHRRAPKDIAENPIILGHELCGEIIEVGANVDAKYHVGQKFTLQPAMRGTYAAAGYSFRFLGGNSQYAIVPKCYLEQGCVLPYEGEGYFAGSLAEPLSCVIGAVHANYHTRQGEYVHDMGIVRGGKMAVLAGCGPMGLALIDYITNCETRPGLLVVTDIDRARLDFAAMALSVSKAAQNGVQLVYVDAASSDATAKMMEISGGTGYNDIFVFAPVSALLEQADALLAHDGCLNFFAGPSDTAFSAGLNFYNVHYNATHVVGTSGGNTDDMLEALEMCAAGKLNPALLLTHIGGLDAVIDTVKQLPQLPGAKKLIYNHISMPLTAIADFAEKGKTDPLFAALAEICARHSGFWSVEAEKYLLENAPKA
ncbi:MAG: zinc-binding dehydrogenase [Clostridiales bacterium]|jgi:threonine dehydrogenase-like Zn-dependent dehydrogenase|nr:zinc-binding dehydrogenase [Clostridiales bacterium]